MADEKPIEEVQKEREAVNSMLRAKGNMELVLKRVETLERALRKAIMNVERLQKYLPENAYPYNEKDSCRTIAGNMAKDYREALNGTD